MAAEVRSDGTPRFEYFVVESSGISEPMAVAEVFDLPHAHGDDDGGAAGTGDDDDGDDGDEAAAAAVPSAEEAAELAKMKRAAVAAEALRRVAYLDCLVTVVDAVNWPDVTSSSDSLADRSIAAGPNDTRAVSELMVEQVCVALCSVAWWCRKRPPLLFPLTHPAHPS